MKSDSVLLIILSCASLVNVLHFMRTRTNKTLTVSMTVYMLGFLLWTLGYALDVFAPAGFSRFSHAVKFTGAILFILAGILQFRPRGETKAIASLDAKAHSK